MPRHRGTFLSNTLYVSLSRNTTVSETSGIDDVCVMGHCAVSQAWSTRSHSRPGVISRGTRANAIPVVEKLWERIGTHC